MLRIWLILADYGGQDLQQGVVVHFRVPGVWRDQRAEFIHSLAQVELGDALFLVRGAVGLRHDDIECVERYGPRGKVYKQRRSAALAEWSALAA